MMSLLTTWIGVTLALRLGENRRAIAAGIGFSVGIMLLIALLELIPLASRELGPRVTALGFLLGAALVWMTHLIVPHIHLVEEQGLPGRTLVRSVYLVVLGLILHDFPEGFSMANAYLASPSLGVIVALAIALHNIPEEFAMAVPVMLTRSRRLLYGSALLSALAEPAGAILGLMVTGFVPGLNAHFMAFAAGAMVFVSLHELLPMAKRYGGRLLIGSGLGASVLLYQALSVFVTGFAA